MPNEQKTVILLASDLMMISSVGGAAAANGLKFQSCSTASAATEACAGAENVLMLIDLGTPGLDVRELADALPPTVVTHAVAYGPHVHTTKLQAARDAGIGTVLSRGQFSMQAGQIVGAFADR
ncbi:MAG: hypothetical protein R3C19_02785 [Planctomycetaceae bacterium]